uniref:Electron transfer flavoprotein regulatory factor 1 n=1 Tax=Aquila chrysaetos chrysaetos TaxID=223781 RepID=A0A663EH28_AQUCH
PNHHLFCAPSEYCHVNLHNFGVINHPHENIPRGAGEGAGEDGLCTGTQSGSDDRDPVTSRRGFTPSGRGYKPRHNKLDGVLQKSRRALQLLYLGREYPKGADYFRSRLKAAFLKNKDVKDPEKIKQLIARGEFVIKELEALYFLRKYRALKQRYYSDDNQ